MTAGVGSRWLQSPNRPRGGVPHLVCLPWAGGSAAAFHGWAAALEAHAEVHTVAYPGRGARFGEPASRDMAETASAVAAAVTPLTTETVVLFGHSMGAAIAFEAARRLEAGGTPVDLVVASGHPAPGRYRSRGIAGLDEPALLAELDRLAGRPGVLSTDPELRELLLPAVRADFALIESYADVTPVPTRTPVAVFRGDGDADVGAAQAQAWSDVAPGGRLVAHRVFPGGHFYLEEHAHDVRSALVDLIHLAAERAT